MPWLATQENLLNPNEEHEETGLNQPKAPAGGKRHNYFGLRQPPNTAQDSEYYQDEAEDDWA